MLAGTGTSKRQRKKKRGEGVGGGEGGRKTIQKVRNKDRKTWG